MAPNMHSYSFMVDMQSHKQGEKNSFAHQEGSGSNIPRALSLCHKAQQVPKWCRLCVFGCNALDRAQKGAVASLKSIMEAAIKGFSPLSLPLIQFAQLAGLTAHSGG